MRQHPSRGICTLSTAYRFSLVQSDFDSYAAHRLNSRQYIASCGGSSISNEIPIFGSAPPPLPGSTGGEEAYTPQVRVISAGAESVNTDIDVLSVSTCYARCDEQRVHVTHGDRAELSGMCWGSRHAHGEGGRVT